jgi:hypothetical protein
MSSLLIAGAPAGPPPGEKKMPPGRDPGGIEEMRPPGIRVRKNSGKGVGGALLRALLTAER